ncbi:hypothetical protein ACQCWA_00325 [Rossellomorea aquimaris]|uniref:hypothetical protein n=1 Tax=Rossellomorea aquimaris TaxID=189382 RepID=UPI003CFB2EC9
MLRFRRLLRTRRMEFFEINNENQSCGYLVFHDTQRESKLKDFPILVGVEAEEDFDSNKNHIEVILFKNNMDEESFEYTNYFISDMLDTKADCSYYIKEYDIKKELEFDMPNHMLGIVDFLSSLFEENMINIDIPEVKEVSFNYLSQE